MHPQATPTRLPRWGAPAPAALLLLQILPVLPPHRANHARRGPRFSVVAPCRRGGAPNAAAALGTPGRLARLGATPNFHHWLLSSSRSGDGLSAVGLDRSEDFVSWPGMRQFRRRGIGARIPWPGRDRKSTR